MCASCGPPKPPVGGGNFPPVGDNNPYVNDPECGLLDRMVNRLVERGFVQTARVEGAFRAVPRHIFLPGVPFDKVYSGNAILTRRGPDGLPYSSSSEVAIMAVMAEQLELEPGHRMLEIGAGTGYNAAILSALVGPEGRVTTMDLEWGSSSRSARAWPSSSGGTGDPTNPGCWPLVTTAPCCACAGG